MLIARSRKIWRRSKILHFLGFSILMAVQSNQEVWANTTRAISVRLLDQLAMSCIAEGIVVAIIFNAHVFVKAH